MEEIRQSFADRNFIKKFSVLIFGTAGAQLISVIAIPVLARIYSVEIFGLQALYISINSILSIAATGRYDLAILLPKKHKDGFVLASLSFLLATFFCIVLECVFFLFAHDLAALLHNKQLVYWFNYLPLTLWTTILYSISFQCLNRLGLYKRMSGLGMLVSIINFLISYCYASAFGANEMGLILYTFVGQLVISIFIFSDLIVKKLISIKEFSWNDLWMQAKRYRDFPKYLILGHMLNALSSQLPIFILQGIFGSVIVGYFSMVQKFLGMPITLISTSVQNVFFREASIVYLAYKNCWAIYKKTFVLLFLLGIMPFCFIFLLAPDVFSLLLGEQWGMAGEYSAQCQGSCQ